ncbi:ATP-binding protein [Streptomyces sp. NPDC051662]|uniref:sensor histidine kinase n=1 Tax=Streptomyces sp. NPDC051662 TaxID=3154750 RepID=UPI00342AE89E
MRTGPGNRRGPRPADRSTADPGKQPERSLPHRTTGPRRHRHRRTRRPRYSGPVVPREAIGSLYQPFQRLGHRSAHTDGHGLGLSIVAAIADAHHARIATAQGPEGGLDITIAFI